MKHRESHQDLLVGYLNGEITPKELVRVETLLAECPECPKIFKAYEAILERQKPVQKIIVQSVSGKKRRAEGVEVRHRDGTRVQWHFVEDAAGAAALGRRLAKEVQELRERVAGPKKK